MVKKLLNVSLQTKITGLVVGLITFIIAILLSIFSYIDWSQVIQSKKSLSLQTAKTISYLPSVRDVLEGRESISSLQFLTYQYSSQNDADFIILQDRHGNILSHPDEEKIGETQDFIDGYMAKVFGGYYNMESDEFLGPAIVGKAPIITDRGVIGVVTVGYLKDHVYASIKDRIKNIFIISLFIIALGFFLSYFLARHIRKDTLGLEPRDVTTLYRNRNTLLSSLSEGVVATDPDGFITLINKTAKKLLNIKNDYLDKHIHSILPSINLSVLRSQENVNLTKEIHINNKHLIVHVVPILEEDKLVGTVTTLRDKTEMNEMVNALYEVNKYSDDLRAQTHEYSNKMHLISGLIQLKRYDDVLELIKEEVNHIEYNNQIIFDQIKDKKVQAILLGKMGKASEKKISFLIDENSYLSELPEHIHFSHIISTIGNLIDNAFDEVVDKPNGEVKFFALDIGRDIIFEVSDNGDGFQEKDVEVVFQPGYTTKESRRGKRGYGLFNVRESVNDLNGTIELETNESGTVITIFLPKGRGNS